MHKCQVTMQKLGKEKRVFSLVMLLCHGAAHNTSVNLGLLAGLNRIMHFKHFSLNKTKCNTIDIVSMFWSSHVQSQVSGEVHKNAFGKDSSRITLFAFLSVHFHNQLSFAKMLPNVSYSRLTILKWKNSGKGPLWSSQGHKKPQNIFLYLKHAFIIIDITSWITHTSVRK